VFWKPFVVGGRGSGRVGVVKRDLNYGALAIIATTVIACYCGCALYKFIKELGYISFKYLFAAVWKPLVAVDDP
jgi:hypothetical protein